MKKIFIILIIIIIIFLIGYFFLRPYLAEKKDPAIENALMPPSITSNIGESLNLEPKFLIKKEVIAALSHSPVLAYWINKADGSVYYILENGKIYEINENGKEESLSNLEFVNINKISPSPSGKMIIVQFKKNSFRIFNTASKSWRALPTGVSKAAWSPTSEEIAYINESLSGVYIFNLSSGRSRKITSLESLDLEINWRKPNKIHLSTIPTSKSNMTMLELDIKTKKFGPIARTRVLIIDWLNDGSIGLALGKNLFFVDATGNILQNLPFVTLPKKCFYSEKILICGVPEKIKMGDLPDSYLQRDVYTNDSLIQISLENPVGAPEILFDQKNETTKFDIWCPQKEGDIIYFINRYDNYLYSFSI